MKPAGARQRFVRLVVVIAVALVGACTSIGTEKRMTALDVSLMTYGKLLRWGELEEAAKYIEFRDRDPVAPDYGGLRDFRITSYDVIDQGLNTDGDEAKVRVRIGYYHEASGVVRSVDDLQVWWYDAERKRWFLDGVLPDLRRARAPDR
ncbi:MAG: hypothetical protein IT495_02680 [Gammaproteobacteria bacterium]|nr:hypothetical protein [Gammaproteobacteria bacterium]